MTRFGLVLAMVMLSSTAVYAQEDANRAAALGLVREGSQLLEKNDYQAALDKFNQAYALVSSPKQFFNQGLALRGLGRNVEAIQAFERFLTEAKDATVEHQDKARAKIAELSTLLVQVDIRCNRSGAAVMVDGQIVAATPLSRPSWVEPGSHQVTLEWQGEKKSAAFTASAGQSVSLVLDFEEPKPLPPPVVAPAPLPTPVTLVQQPAPVQTSRLRSTWLWVGAGAVVAVVGTSLILFYARREHYPSASLGSQPIGGGP